VAVAVGAAGPSQRKASGPFLWQEDVGAAEDAEGDGGADPHVEEGARFEADARFKQLAAGVPGGAVDEANAYRQQGRPELDPKGNRFEHAPMQADRDTRAVLQCGARGECPQARRSLLVHSSAPLKVHGHIEPSTKMRRSSQVDAEHRHDAGVVTAPHHAWWSDAVRISHLALPTIECEPLHNRAHLEEVLGEKLLWRGGSSGWCGWPVGSGWSTLRPDRGSSEERRNEHHEGSPR